MRKLNLGCGYVQPHDWVNVDKIDYGQGNTGFLADVRQGLPMEDSFFDFILMNHTLQMFTYEELPVVLKEVKRVMKDGATLRILTPDFMRAIDMYKNEIPLALPISDEIENTDSGKVIRYIFWHGDTRCAFDTASLISKLQQNGFNDFRSGKYGECELDSREEESLIMETRK